jgi:hypothetical protein
MAVRVYFLRLERATNLQWAFGVVSNARGVVSCTIEPQRRRIRFVAPAIEADALVERIYLDGGLVWCSRHTVRSNPASNRIVHRSATERSPTRPGARSPD